MLAVVAPVVAVDLIVELGILAIAVALILLRRAWVYSFGRLLTYAADTFDSIGFTVPVIHARISLSFIAQIIRFVNTLALRFLGEAIDTTDTAAKRLWHYTAYYAEQTARVMGDLAESTWGELHHLRRWVIPAYVTARLAGLTADVRTLTRELEHLAAHPTTIVRTVTRTLDPRVGSLEREVGLLQRQVAAAASGAVVPVERIVTVPAAGIAHGVDELRAKLGKLARTLTPAGVVGLVAAATLSGLDLGWLKCRGVSRVGRELCGLSGLIETVASDALDVLLVSDLCALTAAIGYAAEAFEPALIAFVDVEDALIGCHGASRPAELSLPALSLPSLQPLTPLSLPPLHA